MLRRFFGARSFDGFWRHWNPIFGYYLGTRVFVPLKRVLPASVALVPTFVVTGMIHDAVTMAVRKDIAFLFTPWFFFLGIGALIAKATRMDAGGYPWSLRAAVHTSYLAVSLGFAFLVFTIR